MARLRFPGRPGQRIGRNYVKYNPDDLKLRLDPSEDVSESIKRGLKTFYELFGSSDEDAEFDGFDLAAERNPKSSGAVSEKDVHLVFSSDSDTSGSIFRGRSGMRTIARKSYDKMIREGIEPTRANGLCNDDLSSRSKLAKKHTLTRSSSHTNIARRLLEKAKRGRGKEKLSKCELPKHVKKKAVIEESGDYCFTQKRPRKLRSSAEPVKRNSRALDSSPSTKTLASVSSRPSRRSPSKPFGYEFDLHGHSSFKKQKLEVEVSTDSCKEYSPEPCMSAVSSGVIECGGCPKRIALLEQPLVVEGKRPWKPSLKVQMKFSEMNYEIPTSSRKSDSSGTTTSSDSFKDGIKKDMVSRYADNMTKKGKEGREMQEQSTSKDIVQVPEHNDKKEDKVAAKIEKLLKSQWEDRLKKKEEDLSTTESQSVILPRQFFPGNQRQRQASKNILRKARLQLNKRTLMKLRQASIVNNLLETPATLTSASSENVVSNQSSPGSLGKPGKIICAICGSVKYYSHIQRRFRQISCEPCNKFYSTFIRSPRHYFCREQGNCPIEPIDESLLETQHPKKRLMVSNVRCRACWLKECMMKFVVTPDIWEDIVKFIPCLEDQPESRLISECDAAHLTTKHENYKDSLEVLANPKRKDPDVERKEVEHKDSDKRKAMGSFSKPKELPSTVAAVVGQETPGDKKKPRQHFKKKAILLSLQEELASAPNNNKSLTETDSEKDASKKPKQRGRQTSWDSSASPSVQSSEKSESKGPRIKHVCRRAAVVLGPPRATFPIPSKARKQPVIRDRPLPTLRGSLLNRDFAGEGVKSPINPPMCTKDVSTKSNSAPSNEKRTLNQPLSSHVQSSSVHNTLPVAVRQNENESSSSPKDNVIMRELFFTSEPYSKETKSVKDDKMVDCKELVPLKEAVFNETETSLTKDYEPFPELKDSRLLKSGKDSKNNEPVITKDQKSAKNVQLAATTAQRDSTTCVDKSRDSVFARGLAQKEPKSFLSKLPKEATVVKELTIDIPKEMKAAKEPLAVKESKVPSSVEQRYVKEPALGLKDPCSVKETKIKKGFEPLSQGISDSGKKVETVNVVKGGFPSPVPSESKPLKKRAEVRGKTLMRARKVRCKECQGCLAKDCGKCVYCLDKKKFGGPNIIRQACMFRRCLRPQVPTMSKPISKPPPEGEEDDGRSPGAPHGGGLGSFSSGSAAMSPSAGSCSSTGSSGGGGGNSGSTCRSFGGSVCKVSGGSVEEPPCEERDKVFGFAAAASLKELGGIRTNVSFGPPACAPDFANADSAIPAATVAAYRLLTRKPLGKLSSAAAGDGCFAGDGGGGRIRPETSSSSSSPNPLTRPNAKGNTASLHKAWLPQVQFCPGDPLTVTRKVVKNDCPVFVNIWQELDTNLLFEFGFAVVSSQVIPAQALCYVCGSSGLNELLFCGVCCELYHPYCTKESNLPDPTVKNDWSCLRCRVCVICKKNGNVAELIMCSTCSLLYHSKCVSHFYPSRPSPNTSAWVCPGCIKCRSCGTSSSSSFDVDLNFDISLCKECTLLIDIGGNCPVCCRLCVEGQDKLQLIHCSGCEAWIHAKCAGISEDMYQLLSYLPESIPYTCLWCSDYYPPHWLQKVQNDLQASYQIILTDLKEACSEQHPEKTNTPLESEQAIIQYTLDHNRKIKSIEILLNDLSKVARNVNECNVVLPELKELLGEDVILSENAVIQVPISMEAFAMPDPDLQRDLDDMFLNIKNRISAGQYKNIIRFCNDIIELLHSKPCQKLTVEYETVRDKFATVILPSKHQLTSSSSKVSILVNTGEPVSLGTSILMDEQIEIHNPSILFTDLRQQIQRLFPWIELRKLKTWPSDPNDKIPVHIDHCYALGCTPKIFASTVFDMKKLRPFMNNLDLRKCVLCGQTGDHDDNKCGRLISMGQDDWIHVNCAVWSAEVIESPDGLLLNVHSAVSRGRMMRCEKCFQSGATVGCYVKGCSANYHFFCARLANAYFLKDHKVFCYMHFERITKGVLREMDFEVKRSVLVDQKDVVHKWMKKSWQAGLMSKSVHINIGSVIIENLGYLTRISDCNNFLLPIDYCCKRMFWSIKDPKVQVSYTFRIIKSKRHYLNSFEGDGVHQTIVHGEENLRSKWCSDLDPDVEAILPFLLESLCQEEVESGPAATPTALKEEDFQQEAVLERLGFICDTVCNAEHGTDIVGCDSEINGVSNMEVLDGERAFVGGRASTVSKRNLYSSPDVFLSSNACPLTELQSEPFDSDICGVIEGLISKAENLEQKTCLPDVSLCQEFTTDFIGNHKPGEQPDMDHDNKTEVLHCLNDCIDNLPDTVDADRQVIIDVVESLCSLVERWPSEPPWCPLVDQTCFSLDGLSCSRSCQTVPLKNSMYVLVVENVDGSSSHNRNCCPSQDTRIEGPEKNSQLETHLSTPDVLSEVKGTINKILQHCTSRVLETNTLPAPCEEELPVENGKENHSGETPNRMSNSYPLRKNGLPKSTVLDKFCENNELCASRLRYNRHLCKRDFKDDLLWNSKQNDNMIWKEKLGAKHKWNGKPINGTAARVNGLNSALKDSGKIGRKRKRRTLDDLLKTYPLRSKRYQDTLKYIKKHCVSSVRERLFMNSQKPDRKNGPILTSANKSKRISSEECVNGQQLGVEPSAEKIVRVLRRLRNTPSRLCHINSVTEEFERKTLDVVEVQTEVGQVVSTFRTLRNTPSRLCHIKNILSNCSSPIAGHSHKHKSYSSTAKLSFVDNRNPGFPAVLSESRCVSLNDSFKEDMKENDIEMEGGEFSKKVNHVEDLLLESCSSQIIFNKDKSVCANSPDKELVFNQSKTSGNFKVFSNDSTDLFKCSKCKRTYRTKESYQKHETSCTFVVDSSSEEEEEDENTELSEDCDTKFKEPVKLMVDKCIQTDSQLVEIEPQPLQIKDKECHSLDSSCIFNDLDESVNSPTKTDTNSLVMPTSPVLTGPSPESICNIISEPPLTPKAKRIRRKSSVVKCTDDEVAEKVKAILSQQSVSRDSKSAVAIKENVPNMDSVSVSTPISPSSLPVSVPVELPSSSSSSSSRLSESLVPPSLSKGSSPAVESLPVLPPKSSFPPVSDLTLPPLSSPSQVKAAKRIRSTKKPDLSHPVFRPKSSVPLSILPKPNILSSPKQREQRQTSDCLQPSRSNPMTEMVPQVDPSFMYGTLNTQTPTFVTNSLSQPLPQLPGMCEEAEIIQIPYGTLVIPKKSNNLNQTIMPVPQQAPVIYGSNYGSPFGSILSQSLIQNSQPNLSYLGSITVTNNDLLNLSLNVPLVSAGMDCSGSPMQLISQQQPQQQYLLGPGQDILVPHYQEPQHAHLNYMFHNPSVQTLHDVLTEPVVPYQNPDYVPHVLAENRCIELENFEQTSSSSGLVNQVTNESNFPQGDCESLMKNNSSVLQTNCDKLLQEEDGSSHQQQTLSTPEDVSIDKCLVPGENKLDFLISSCDTAQCESQETKAESESHFSNNKTCSNSGDNSDFDVCVSDCKTDEDAQSEVCVNIKDEKTNTCLTVDEKKMEKEEMSKDLSKLCYSDTFISIIRKAAEQMLQLSSKLAEQKETMQQGPRVATFKKKNLKNAKDSVPPLPSPAQEKLKQEQDYDYSVKASVQPSSRVNKKRSSSATHLPEKEALPKNSSHNHTADNNSALTHAQESHILFEISNEDGFCVRSTCINEAWQAVLQRLQEARKEAKLPFLNVNEDELDGLAMMGLKHSAVTYLLEQLPGAEKCLKYKFKFHKPLHPENLLDNPNGCIRAEEFRNRSQYDMFNFLASRHRRPPTYDPSFEEEDVSLKSSSRRATSLDLPMAMRFRHLKDSAREAVGVYKSRIHGRGLFCKRPIDAGEMIIEYAGEVIRSVLTDKREKLYESKGIGCYMFRIDDNEVVDATMHGNAARFINHSCDPNCFSRVICLDGKKHIVIFALRRIWPGEELTYDYKFPFEEIKIPCTCGSKKCRKYLN